VRNLPILPPLFSPPDIVVFPEKYGTLRLNSEFRPVHTGQIKFRVRQQLTSRRKTDWLASRSKRLCRVKITFNYEVTQLPERGRLRVVSGKSSAHVIVAPHLTAGRDHLVNASLLS